MFPSDVAIGTLIIVVSMLCGFVFCISTCLILWLRYKDGAVPTFWSKFVFRQRSLNYDLSPEEASHEILVFPTITHSQPGSEPSSTNASSSSSIPLNPYDQRYFQTFPDSSGSVLSADRSPKPCDPSRKCPSSPGQSAQTKFPHDYPESSLRRPSTLMLGPSAFSTVSSESGTSASPADFDSLRTHFRHPETSHSSTDDLPSPTTPKDYSIFYAPKQSGKKHKFKIGTLKINIKYFCSQKTFQINLLNDYQLPSHIDCKEEDLYAKFSLTLGDSRIRCSKPLNCPPREKDSEVIATFQHEADVQQLSQASVVTTLCKKMPTTDQGMVIGCAFVNIGELSLSAFENFDSGNMELPLEDCNPHQMMFCGGFLQCLIDLPLQGSPLTLTNIQLSGMDLSKIFREEKSDRKGYVQLYLKITVYENGEAVFWRRTTPVIVTTTTQVITLASQALLEVTPKKLNTLQLVLSVRLKTGKRGERCVLGNIYLGESWFSNQMAARRRDKDFSSKTILYLPLDQ